MFSLSVFLKDRLLARSTFKQEEVRIGRSTDNEVHLENLAVSRYHAAIETAGGAQVLRDFGTELGTYVNGDRVQGRRALVDGDRIGIAKFTLVFRGDRNTPTRPMSRDLIRDKASYALAGQTIVLKTPPAEMRERTCPMVAHLEFPSDGNTAPRIHHLERDICLVGSAPESDLVLDPKLCPPRLCVLVRGFTGFSILTLAPGAKRNRLPLEGRALLTSRDELVFGSVPCKFFMTRNEVGP